MFIYLLGTNIVEDKTKRKRKWQNNEENPPKTSRFEIGIKQTRVGYPSLELPFLLYDLNTYISCHSIKQKEARQDPNET